MRERRRLRYGLVTGWHEDSFVRDLRAIGGSDRPIMVMDADGSHVHRLSATLGLDAVPGWQAKAPPKGQLSATIDKSRLSFRRPGRVHGPGDSLSLEERHDLADEALERFGVVRREGVGDHGPKSEFHIGPQPVGQLFRRPIPEGRVVLDAGHRRPGCVPSPLARHGSPRLRCRGS